MFLTEFACTILTRFTEVLTFLTQLPLPALTFTTKLTLTELAFLTEFALAAPDIYY